MSRLRETRIWNADAQILARYTAPMTCIKNPTVAMAALLSSGIMLLVAGCGLTPQASVESRVSTSAQAAATTAGYLRPEERPDSVSLIPPPPGKGSAGFDRDERIYREMFRLEGSSRWRMAAADANLKFPDAPNAFACAIGITITEARTPHLYTLLQRVVIDAGQSTYPAKRKYNRSRPFTIAGDAICVPEDEQLLRSNAAYPSGHASLGYVWGEVLAEVAPERAAELRARGYQFSESRVVCRVHWQSDVDAGRAVGEAVIARLRQDAQFLADLAAARAEVVAAREGGQAAGRDCAAEAAALAVTAVP
jgi:acid phosphatase (class A)